MWFQGGDLQKVFAHVKKKCKKQCTYILRFWGILQKNLNVNHRPAHPHSHLKMTGKSRACVKIDVEIFCKIPQNLSSYTHTKTNYLHMSKCARKGIQVVKPRVYFTSKSGINNKTALNTKGGPSIWGGHISEEFTVQ